MKKRVLQILLLFILPMSLSMPASATNNLCTDGTLLFREDFGGNDPEDPRVSTTPVPGMTYTQLLTDNFGVMGSGKYLVTKMGYCNGDTSVNNPGFRASQWYIQDDHTYPGDYNRGYFMEVDGRADNKIFYTKTISDLVVGQELTFLAYIANVEMANYYIINPWKYVYPRLKFTLINPTTNEELASYETGDIPYDTTYTSNADWIHSSKWRLVGMNFTVPAGVPSITLQISNSAQENKAGNDFAIDDIEIRLCQYQLTSDLCMDGTLLFREDFGGNDPEDPVAGIDPAPGMTSSYMQIFDTATCNGRPNCRGMASGRYLLTKVGYRNSRGYNYSHWFIMDDHTYPNDYTRGYLLEIDGRTDNATLFETVIDDLCEGAKLTFSAYVTNVTTYHSYYYDHNDGDPQLSFVLVDPMTGKELTTYETGPIPVDKSYKDMPEPWRHSAHWNLVGMNFTVPPGRTAIKLIIKNACISFSGNDFAIDDIEIRLCAPRPEIISPDTACKDLPHRFDINFDDDGTLPHPLEYKWWFSSDGTTWEAISGADSSALVIEEISAANTGWYKMAVSGSGGIDKQNCRTVSEPFHLKAVRCQESLPDELCTDGLLLFKEDFGGNEVSDRRVRMASVAGMEYSQLLTDSRGIMVNGRYIVTKSGYCLGDTSQTAIERGSRWFIQDDHTYPNDYSRGYFMEVNGRCDKASLYTATINGLTDNAIVSFSAYVANVQLPYNYVNNTGISVYPRLKFTLTNPADGQLLKRYDTGVIPYDSTYMSKDDWPNSSQWRLVGFNYRVPAGVNSINLQVFNNAADGEGDDFAIDDIEVRWCDSIPPVVPIDTTATDTVPTTPIDTPIVIPPQPIDTCPGYIIMHHDTTVCDTAMPYRWHGVQFNFGAEKRVITEGASGCDSVLNIYNLRTTHCERTEVPEEVPVTPVDSVPTDTIPTTPPSPQPPSETPDNPDTPTAPDTPNPPDNPDNPDTPETPTPPAPNPPTPSTPPTPATPSSQTLYPIIVNKYDYVLLVNNNRVAELFPNNRPVSYQWYKDEVPIAGATEDDYSEQGRLVGTFQMYITMDNESVIQSNIITIKPLNEQRIYRKLYAITPHIYAVYIEDEDGSRIEKVLIP